MSFLNRVSEGSALTEAQIEALHLYRRVMSGELSLRKAAKMRKRPTTGAAYWRVIRQGKDNLKAAIMTVTAGIWLGYLKPEDLKRLFELVAKSPSPFEEEPSDELLQVLQVLVEKMVT